MDQTRSALILLLAACGEGAIGSLDAGSVEHNLPYATSVIDFAPGPGAGFGGDQMPGVVLGPPQGYGVARGGMHVLSLGRGGQITLGFEPRVMVDGPGVDLIVFENVFWVGGDPNAVFAELGRVELSEDGQTWHAFDCQQNSDEVPSGCAGWTPTLVFDLAQPLDPERCGGDGFDMADLGLTQARYLRITDLSQAGETPSAGFDLDAVGLVHHR